ncbi:MAG: ATP-binding protein [Deltaproteobacteria bacterium]|nr:ATP-binding protein [Deltaproteobacteria bacterium]
MTCFLSGLMGKAGSKDDLLKDDLSELLVALSDKKNRWVVLDGCNRERALQVHKTLEKPFKPLWIPIHGAKEPLLSAVINGTDSDLVVIDARSENDLSHLAKELSLLFSLYSHKRFLILGYGNLTNIVMPVHADEGKFLSLPFSADLSRDDSALLQHARKLEPKYSLSDLVLSPGTKLKFEEAVEYIETRPFCENDWGFRKRHSRGHGVTLLFHGTSGTGKTMAAEVIANVVGLPLYQIDLSSVISKWVGETEKNLKAIFRAAEGVRGILLFDEGDAIFGQRTKVENSQDKYQNLEVNFLLQEIEVFNGIAVLSTNHDRNLDPAFLRRFTYAINFNIPDQDLRAKIWRANVPAELPLGKTVDFSHLALFQMSGGMIRNCIRYAAARAAAQKKSSVEQEDFLWALKREQQKHGEELNRTLVGETYWKKVAPEWENYRGPTPPNSSPTTPRPQGNPPQ